METTMLQFSEKKFPFLLKSNKTKRKKPQSQQHAHTHAYKLKRNWFESKTKREIEWILYDDDEKNLIRNIDIGGWSMFFSRISHARHTHTYTKKNNL